MRFFDELDRAILSSELEENLDKLLLYNDVKNFVMKGTFSDYKNRFLLLDYWGVPSPKVEEQTGIKQATVKWGRAKMSDSLYELFGYDFFNVTAEGTDTAIKEGYFRLHLAEMNYRSSDFIYREIINSIRENGSLGENIDILSCKEEIKFLVKHSKQSVEDELAELDKDKLCYLLGMLDNKVGNPKNIRNLIKCFEVEKEDNYGKQPSFS